MSEGSPVLKYLLSKPTIPQLWNTTLQNSWDPKLWIPWAARDLAAISLALRYARCSGTLAKIPTSEGMSWLKKVPQNIYHHIEMPYRMTSLQFKISSGFNLFSFSPCPSVFQVPFKAPTGVMTSNSGYCTPYPLLFALPRFHQEQLEG